MNKYFQGFVIISLIFTTSCTLPYYVPQNNLLSPPDGKGDVRVAINNHILTNDFQFSAAYSPVNHVGIGFSHLTDNYFNNTSFMLGYYFNNYKYIESSDIVRGLMADVYLSYHNVNGEISNSANNFFLQISPSAHVDITELRLMTGIHFKMNAFTYDLYMKGVRSDIRQLNIYTETWTQTDIDIVLSDDLAFFPEFSFQTQYLKNNIRVLLGMNWAHNGKYNSLYFNKLNIYGGVGIDIDHFWRTKEYKSDNKKHSKKTK